MQRRTFLKAIGAGALALREEVRAADKALTLIVPYAPGGTTDLLGRLVAQTLSAALGRTAAVENRPGGGSVIGAGHAARAAPDGGTLLIATSTTLAINPLLHRKLPYDAHDFVPVAQLAAVPLVLVTRRAAAAGSLAELVRAARGPAGPSTYGSAGIGSPQHLAGALLGSSLGLRLVHVPYAGTAPALTDLLAGRIDLVFSDIAPALPHLRSGSLQALGVSSRQRQAVLPEVPTIAESGLEGTPTFEAVAWQGVVAPPGTPEALLQPIGAALERMIERADIRERLQRDGIEPVWRDAAGFAAYLRAETERWRRVVAAAEIKVE